MHKSKTGDKFWEELRTQIIKDYTENNKSASQIGRELGCYGTTIS